MYLSCANNNRASTVYDLFLGAVQQYGLPSRLRCDQGGENRVVALHLLHHRGEERSVLVGNTINVWNSSGVICIDALHNFSIDFTTWSTTVSWIQHQFALHYVYKPRINEGLKHFLSVWNNHPNALSMGIHQSSYLQLVL